MKKITLMLLLLVFAMGSSFGQCIATAAFGNIASNNSGSVQTITTCNFGGEYGTVTGLIIGGSYTFTSTAPSITITDTSNNVIGFGPSPVTVTGVTVSTLRSHIHSSPFPTCGTASTCYVSAVQYILPGCIATSAFGSAVSDNSGNVQTISTCNFGGEYATVTNLLVGQKYKFASTAGYVTVTDFSNNILGAGASPVTINAVSVTSVRVHQHTSGPPSCGTASTCFVSSVQLILPPPPPANDLCVNAIAITGDGVINATTVNATVDAVPACITGSVAPGVWYTITDASGTAGSSVTLSLCGSSYDTKLAVFSGSCGAFACVAYNDDSCGVQSQLTFVSDGSSTYHVLVYGFSTATGTFTLTTTGFPGAVIGNPPTIACPADIVINNAVGTCGAVANFVGIALDDEDGNISGSIIATPASGSTFAVGATTVELSVTDSDGNNATCEFTVTVIDNEAPVAVCQDITVDLDPITGLATVAATDVDNGSTDNCGIASYTLDVSSFDCSMTGANTVVLTVTDNSGNATTCTSTVTVQDVTAPVINCLGGIANVSVSEDFEGASVPAGWSTVIQTGAYDWTFGSGDMPLGNDFPTNAAIFDDDAAGPGAVNVASLLSPVYDISAATTATVSFDYILKDFIGFGFLSVEVYDGAAWQQILLVDDIDVGPINTGDLDMMPYANANFQVRFTYDDEGSWAYGAGVDNFLLNYEIAAGGGLDVYLDADGMASVNPNDLIMSVDEACGYTITAGGAGGGTSGSLTTLFATNNGGSSGWAVLYDVTVGPADIEVTELDINANATSAFTVDLYVLTGTYVGNELNPAAWGAPAASGSGTGAGTDLPSNVVLGTPVMLLANTTYGFAVVTTGVGQSYTNGNGTNQNYSNGDLSIALGSAVTGLFTGSVFTPRIWNGAIHYTTGGSGGGLDFTCADLGENQIEVTVTDDSGNVSTCIATVNVIDNIAPVITCGPSGAPISQTEDFNGATIPTGWSTEVLVGAADWGFGSGDMPNGDDFTSNAAIFNDDAAGSGQTNKVSLSSPVYDLTGATDVLVGYDVAFQESGDQTFTVEVYDGAAWQQIALYDADLVPNIQTESIDASAYANAAFQVRWTFDDLGGWGWGAGVDNFDLSYSVATTGNVVEIELGPDGTTTVDPYSLLSNIDEACGISTIAVDVPTVDCSDIGATIMITVFVSDASGNIASCTAEVNVVDKLAPVITCPADQTVDPGAGNLFYIVPDYFATGEATAVDNCTDPVTLLTQSPAPGTALPEGPQTITMTATDEYGNVSTCSFVLTVQTVLGVDSNNLDSGLALYPNPAGNVVNLLNKTNISLEKMMIYDINGKLVSQTDLRTMQGEKAVDVSSLAAGVYVVQIIGDNATTVKRLIKE